MVCQKYNHSSNGAMLTNISVLELTYSSSSTVQTNTTVSASNEKPVKCAGAPVTTVRPKLAKQTPPKTARKPAPYDFKARFALLKETHDALKTTHVTLKEQFNEQSDELEVLTSSTSSECTQNGCRVEPHRNLTN